MNNNYNELTKVYHEAWTMIRNQIQEEISYHVLRQTWDQVRGKVRIKLENEIRDSTCLQNIIW